MTNLLILFLPVLWVHLFALFDGAQTARKDYPFQNNLIWYWIRRQFKPNTGTDALIAWYIGGNDRYPPGHPWKCDFWHFMKWCWTLCISGTTLSAMLAILILPYLWKLYTLLYIFLYGVEGFSFSFYYSYVFRSDVSFFQYARSIFKPWRTQRSA